MPERGRFITIEGGDGSGKGTQSEKLVTHLKRLGKQAVKISFPRYKNPSAWYAEQYLNGIYGAADEVPADLAVLAFALDRYAAKDEIDQQLDDGLFVVADRYMASNLAHQGTKFASETDRQEFYERTLTTEYGILQIPKPDHNVVLLMPTHPAQLNVDKKAERTYTTAKRDIHEADASHLDRAKANYEELCTLYPEEFTAIQCVDEESVMRSIESIQAEIQAVLGIVDNSTAPQV